MSKDRGSELSEPARLALALVCLVVLGLLGMAEPILADHEDCAARGKPASCWQDTR